ncbi:MAG TPA: alpha/beta hydrolase [Solirubrobacteraceae bacterium]|nr:alpha/beta hydrolase [Solirubrobacteraceae bacterium]
MTTSTAISTACRGQGPDTPLVVLIHGVGFGPETLGGLAAALATQAPVIRVTRRGYGERAHLPPAASVALHVEDVLAVLDEAEVSRAVIAGMSGGATIALALAIACPERVVAAVVHEPAVGSVAPKLRALVRDALTRGGGSELLRVLAGAETWDALTPAAVAALDASSRLVEADAAAFLAFEPHLASARGRVPLVCSVGEHSSVLRHAVAEQLAERMGAPVAVVPGCRHLPQLDAPEAFAELILEHAFTLPRGPTAP